MSPRHMLRVIGATELTTLAVMLANLLAIHLPEATRILGPLHGLTYTATVITAVLVMDEHHRVWLFALIPGIGGLLAARVASPARLQREPTGDRR